MNTQDEGFIDGDDNPSAYTLPQQKAMAIAPRIMAMVSFGCAVWICVLGWKRRQRIYHRLMFGLGMNLVVWSIFAIYGTAAVPEGTPGVWGARGTTQTCTLQGFASQLGFTVPFYYIGLSMYSYQAVLHNFEAQKYQWIEKWIHIGVYIFPVATGIYLIYIKALNFNGGAGCWVASVPLGCGDTNPDGVVCTRGPQNIEEIVWRFTGIPGILIMILPTVVMFVLWSRVKRLQSIVQLQAKTVARQSGMYLLALYWAYTFSFINAAISMMKGKHIFGFALFSICNESLIGLWIMLCYLHFSAPDSSSISAAVVATSNGTKNEKVLDSTSRMTFKSEDRGLGGSSMDIIATNSISPGNKNIIINTSEHAINIPNTSQQQRQQHKEQPSFNIFDGTNVCDSSPWAAFLHEGDSDDQMEDVEESNHWVDTVQN